MNKDILKLVKEAFKYHAPSIISISSIQEFINWYQKILVTEDDIKGSISTLLNESFIHDHGNGQYQIESAVNPDKYVNEKDLL